MKISPEDLKSIKTEVREYQSPYFETSDIEYYFNKNNGDKNKTIYELLILKAEDSTITVNGLSTKDTSAYFRRIASRYKTFNSGVLK